jgi:hypothetical protein
MEKRQLDLLRRLLVVVVVVRTSDSLQRGKRERDTTRERVCERERHYCTEI